MYTKTKAVKEFRRAQAEAVDVASGFKLLSVDEKLARLPPEPGAKKQRAKLLALKAAGKTGKK